nr:MAG TPA: hypothetical protein [Caudoviricetes sp.]
MSTALRLHCDCNATALPLQCNRLDLQDKRATD